VDIVAWLRGLGLPQYEPAFRDNDIDEELLPTLTEADLREIGVASLGHRKRLLAAVAALAGTADARPTATAPAPSLPSPGQWAERRQVSVLFCDLVGSTALAVRLDPEDLRKVMAAYRRRAAEVVRRWEGHVAQYTGDGRWCVIRGRWFLRSRSREYRVGSPVAG
jgi:class 3 adenylate cyclase